MATTVNEVVVLVVEDHDAARDTLAEFLTVCGFQVHTAPDGREGVELAMKIHPDVIVMDLAMPVMDGWEATRRLKANLTTRSIPVVSRPMRFIRRCSSGGCVWKRLAIERIGFSGSMMNIELKAGLTWRGMRWAITWIFSRAVAKYIGLPQMLAPSLSALNSRERLIAS